MHFIFVHFPSQQKTKGSLLNPLTGINLQTVVSDICNEGGLHIDLEATNHSLRASAAIRIYHAGVDEQLISEVTGQRLDAIRNYK